MPAISLKCCFLSSLAVLPAFACRQSRGNSKECCHSVLLFEKQKNTAGQKENPSVRRRCVCYTKSAYCLGMYAVLGLCQVLGAMQDDTAADPYAIRRVFFKKEAVRLAVIINDDLFCATPLEMPLQDPSQLAPQNGPPGNLMEIFPAVELITGRGHLRDGEVAPFCAIHILSIFHEDMERLIGQPNTLLPAVYFAGTDLLEPDRKSVV